MFQSDIRHVHQHARHTYLLYKRQTPSMCTVCVDFFCGSFVRCSNHSVSPQSNTLFMYKCPSNSKKNSTELKPERETLTSVRIPLEGDNLLIPNFEAQVRRYIYNFLFKCFVSEFHPVLSCDGLVQFLFLVTLLIKNMFFFSCCFLCIYVDFKSKISYCCC